jgi:hypothetical protein
MPTGVMRAPDVVNSNRRGQFAFSISFKPRSACADWEQAQANLRRTIRSARGVGLTGAAIVAVACHDEPELGDVGGKDVHVLRVPFAEPARDAKEGVRDMARKRRFIGAWLRKAFVSDEAYVMFLDADDLVHKDILDYVLTHGHGSYVVDQGYVLDLSSGVVWRRRQGFHLTCGSSFVCRFGRDELPSSWEDDASPFGQFGSSLDQRGHSNYDQVAAELGRPPAVLPFPGVVYTVNHSESLWRAKTGGRRSSPSPRDFVWPGDARRILEDEFGAPDLARRAAGLGRVSSAFARASGARLWASVRSRGSRWYRRHSSRLGR